MIDYQGFLDGIDRKAYHEGEFQWEEDGYTVTRTYQYSPPGCHNSCGVLFYTKDGKLEKVEGDPLSPWANGKLCVRCLALDEAVNNETRLKYPMRRAGERGENKWERISWEEALDEIEQKVRTIWEESGSEYIICVHGTGRNINWQMPYFGAAALKTPNIGTMFFAGFACYIPRVVGLAATMGDYMLVDASMNSEKRYSDPDWRPPEVVMIWGNEPLKSNADGYMGHWLVPCVQMGTKIISVDPRLTWWGARAEYWLPLRPGTDGELALAFLNVIISEDLIDHEFVDLWCAGYEELSARVLQEQYTPEAAAEICGVPAEGIRGAARLYANAKPGAIQWGLALDQQLGAMSACLAIADLMAICGNIDVPGGEIIVRNAFDMDMGPASGEEHIPPEAMARKLVYSTLGGNERDFVAHAASSAVLNAIETGEPYLPRMMWIQSSNALSCAGMAAPRVIEALKKIEYIVYADPFITPTAVAAADLMLPVAMSPERNSARVWWTPLRTMSKVCDFYEAKSDEEIIIAVGKRLNPEAFPFETDVDFINWFIQVGTGGKQAMGEGIIQKTGTKGEGIEYTDVAQNHCGYRYDDWDSTYYKYKKNMLRRDGGPGFNTPSGRYELASSVYEMWGLDRTPFHVEPPEGPVTTPELMEEYPLVLTTGGRSWEFFHSENRQLPTMRELHPVPRVTIHPEDARTYGIEEGQWCWIENDQGRFMQKAFVSPTVKKSVVHTEHGWWFPERKAAEPTLYGTFDSNSNNCTYAFSCGQGGVGAPIKSLICKVYPCQEGDVLPHEQIMEKGGFKENKTKTDFDF